MMNRLPDFIIIGAGKCGTTSLYYYLKQHPQIFMCSKKEAFFFINETSRNNLKPWGAVTNLEEYRALFKDAPINSVIGEISTNYYVYPESAWLIDNLIPQVKIIAILRDPAERAFSDYQMGVFEGHEKNKFSDLIFEDNKYVKRGFYHAELLPFLEVFSPEQIKILLFDDFCKDPIDFIQDLFRYIKVDDSFVPDISIRARESKVPKNSLWHTVLTKPNLLRTSVASVLKLFIPLELRQNLRTKIVETNTARTTLSLEERKQLIEIYRNDILKLQELIQKDLSSWLE